MKRLVGLMYVIAAAFVLSAVFMASDAVAGGKEKKEVVLPGKAKTFVSEYIDGDKIVKSKDDGDKFKIECASGTKIDFDRNGEWREIKNGKHGIPASAIKVLPNAAVLYLRNNYNDVAVKKIERRLEGYLVELDTSPDECEILFAKEGNVKKIMHDN